MFSPMSNRANLQKCCSPMNCVVFSPGISAFGLLDRHLEALTGSELSLAFFAYMEPWCPPGGKIRTF